MTGEPGLMAVRAKFGPDVEEYIRTLPDRAWRQSIAQFADEDTAREAIRRARTTLAQARRDASYALDLGQAIVGALDVGTSLVGVPSVRSLVVSQMEAGWYRSDEEAQRHMAKALALEKRGMPETAIPTIRHQSVDQLQTEVEKMAALVEDVGAREEKESKPWRAIVLRMMNRQLDRQVVELEARTARG